MHTTTHVFTHHTYHALHYVAKLFTRTLAAHISKLL